MALSTRLLYKENNMYECGNFEGCLLHICAALDIGLELRAPWRAETVVQHVGADLLTDIWLKEDECRAKPDTLRIEVGNIVSALLATERHRGTEIRPIGMYIDIENIMQNRKPFEKEGHNMDIRGRCREVDVAGAVDKQLLNLAATPRPENSIPCDILPWKLTNRDGKCNEKAVT